MTTTTIARDLEGPDEASSPQPNELSRLSLLWEVRDRVFQTTRGGQRATDLYYQHSPAMFGAVMADMTLPGDFLSVIDLWRPNLEALVAGNADGVNVTQAQVDAINEFLDDLRAAAAGDLVAAIDRERARVGLDSWPGMSVSDAFASFNAFSCDGFETELLCGEINGDCRVTATDALAILRIAVGSDPPRAEADVDGNGSVAASDALFALLIAVGTQSGSTLCNAS